jgi:flagellar hook-associated protein 1
MSLATGLNVALSGLSVASDQVAIASRNIARAGVAGASRKHAEVVSLSGGGIRTATILRDADAGLRDQALTASAEAGRYGVLANKLDALGSGYFEPGSSMSPGALIGQLSDALQFALTNPADPVRQGRVVALASDLTRVLNAASNATTELRLGADAEMAETVGRVNGLLVQVEQVNDRIVAASTSRTDVTDLLDERDQMVREISVEIGVRVSEQDDGGLMLHTDSGIVLFDGRARALTFSASPGLTAGISGNAILIDGVPAIGGQKIMEVGAGRLKGLAEFRDEVAPVVEAQFDEIARSLVEAFAEYDQTPGGSQAPRPGLFTFPGAVAIPAAGLRIAGLAKVVMVHPNIDPTRGGDVRRIRDGAISSPGQAAFTYNVDGSTGYSDRIEDLIGKLGAVRSFDPSAGVGTQSTLAGFAAGSVAQFQSNRQSMTSASDYRVALMVRSEQALSSGTGINLDQEMARLLEIERAFQASSRIVRTIDEMLQTLLNAVG